ncbi:MAG TPA: malectin domain-containing carbohydrate-binding protein [Micromonosporaceae bacterium]|nr:malectin domain-containing carbohydrate-binding protein [Micromonosporaceae bacterium]
MGGIELVHHSPLRRRVLAVTCGLAALAAGAVGAAPAPGLAAPGHTGIVGSLPPENTPNIVDGNVRAIYDAGSKVIAVGSFTGVKNRNTSAIIPRNYVLAFNKSTGQVDTAFVPVVDGLVNAVIAGPTPGTVYIGGKFNNVNSVVRRKVALLNVADGSLVTTFRGPAINALVTDLALVGDRLLLGGQFTLVAGLVRNGLASLNATTGANDPYLSVSLTENHNYNGTGVEAAVGVEKFALSPDGTKLVVVGNFKKANGVLHDQVVMINLGTTAAIANWNTDRYQPRCADYAFDSYVRDVAFSPAGGFFVIVTSGGPFTGTLCDTAARWETGYVGTAAVPTWVLYTGGDTLLSTTITEHAVYIGGHMRWANNTLGRDNAGPGAVARPSLAALDPLSGVPLKWNPGRHPRGYGVSELYATPEGLWIGHDTDWMGNEQHRRERVAYLSLADGYTPHSTTPPNLPGTVYLAGNGVPSPVLYRVNAGGPTLASTDGGPDWAQDTLAAPSPYHNTGSWVNAPGTLVGSVDTSVPSTTPTAVFSDQRYDLTGLPEMHWGFPVAAGTQIELRLYFSNRCTCTQLPGQRKFNVLVDGTNVLPNFDISATVGHNKGMARTIIFTSDGNVDIDFTRIVENPIVDAIEIVKTAAAPPPVSGNGVSSRTYDGATGVGANQSVANPDNTPWSTARGAFWVGGTLFYGMNGALYRRTFDGATFGAPTFINPYSDPAWDNVVTDSGPAGQTYRGVTTNFYAEIPSVTAMFYWGGRIYYTLSGQSGLFWRWFSPDSGIVGPDKFTVAGATQFADAGGVFVSGTKLYLVGRSTGNLSRMDWVNGAPSGTLTVVSGPTVDAKDWRGKAVFIGP